MALTKAEQAELDQLRKRAENAEAAAEELISTNEESTAANAELRAANENLANANDGLASANDKANVKIAQAAVDQQNAVDEAVEATEASMRERVELEKGGKADKSVSPAKALPFDRGAYYSTCHGGGQEAYAQNGWFYDGAGKPLSPTRKPKR